MIESLLRACRADIRGTIEKQLATYDEVIRYENGREVIIGRYFLRRAWLPKKLKIPVKVDEFEFGKTVFICEGKKFTCSFFIVEGFLRNLRFSKPVPSVSFEVIETTLDYEFFGKPGPASARSPLAVPVESMPLLQQYTQLDIIRAFAPLPADSIALHYKRLGQCLPDDYFELIQQVEGFEFKRGMVYGISKAFIPGGIDNDHVTLAEVYGFGQVCCRRRGDKVELFVLDSEDLEVTRSGKNFRDTLLDFVKRSL